MASALVSSLNLSPLSYSLLLVMSDNASSMSSPAEIRETTPVAEATPAVEDASVGKATPTPTSSGKTLEAKKKKPAATTKKNTTTKRVAAAKKASTTRRTSTTKKTTASKAAPPKAKTSATAKAKVAKEPSSSGRPPWITIIQVG